MDCRNCNSQLSFGASYCENCGERGPSSVEWAKYFGKAFLTLLKKRIWLPVSIVGILVIVVGFSVFQRISHKIDVADYIVIETIGFNEGGRVEVSVDYESLCGKLIGEIPSPDSKKGYEEYVAFTSQIDELKDAVIVSSDRHSDLKNGDFFLVTVQILEKEIFEKYGFELEGSEYRKAFQIGKDCPEFEAPVELDLFDYIDAVFVGENGHGTLQISSGKKDETLTFQSGKQMEISIVYERSWFEHYLVIFTEDPYVSTTVNLRIPDQSNLSNGDTIELYIDQDKAHNLDNFGILVKSYSRTYQVSGLTN